MSLAANLAILRTGRAPAYRRPLAIPRAATPARRAPGVLPSAAPGRRPPPVPVASLALAGLTGGCISWAATDVPGVAEGPEPGTELALETVATGLVVPWDVDFAPDGRIFLTERPGRVRVVGGEGLRDEPWATLDVAATREAGLMGIALAPDFAESGHLYVVATVVAGDRLVNRVIRFAEREGRGTDPTVVVDELPAAPFHAGAALAFGPDGMLYVTAGDVQRPELAQDRRSLAGKILRYRPDGTVAPDNPFPDSPVYALGVRNSQGLAWDPETGALFATDHGPSGAPNEGFRGGNDELNAILPGANYGWPEGVGRNHAGFVPPLALWEPALAPSGLALYTGPHAPWIGDLFVGCLRGHQLHRVRVERDPEAPTGWRVRGERALFNRELGRIRAVAMGPDGHLYITTSNRDGKARPGPEDDRLLRVVARAAS